MTSILPPNSSAFLRAMETAVKVKPVPRVVRPLFDPMTCPIALLPWLAWQLGVRTWSNDWPEMVRRRRVARAAEIARRQGTLSAVRTAVAVFGGQISIREWWQTTPRGQPHSFSLVLALAGDAPDTELIEQVIDEVRAAKPLRSQFTFAVSTRAGGHIGVACAARPAVLLRLKGEA